jgi:hypothetical protein
MRVPISGIVTGFRIHSGNNKQSDIGQLDILQVGTKDFPSSLIHVYVQDVRLLEYLLTHYSNGDLRWIDTYCVQTVDGRDKIWLLLKILSFSEEMIEVEDAPND